MSSNAGQRSASGTERKTSASQSRQQTASTSERRTEKNTILTKERITVRTRSPVKQPSENRAGSKRARETEKVAAPVENVKKKGPEEPRGATWLYLHDDLY